MSTATSRPEYSDLLARALPSMIHSEKENERCLAMLENLDQKGKLSPAEQRLAELLTLLIEDFEEKVYALKPANPAEILNELIEANSLKQKDLVDVFGTPSIVSEVLNGKRRLTIEHIKKLSRRFHLSPEVFFFLILFDHHFLVRGQRDQREVLPVEVVHEVEDAGEAGASVPNFVPRAVFFLGLEEIGDAA